MLGLEQAPTKMLLKVVAFSCKINSNKTTINKGEIKIERIISTKSV